MRLLSKLAVASTIAAIFTTAAHAQFMRVAVPFKFSAGTQVLPAGEYTLKVDHAKNNIAVLSVDGKTGCFIPMQTTFERPALDRGRLEFAKYGNAHFLHRILPSGTSAAAELFTSRAEREASKRNTTREVAMVYGMSR